MSARNEVSQDLSTGFRQRCESALTHPVTIGALGVLLVNDLLLKALWSNPWTTGKLSDLAWVVFASPLLAFLLSLVTRGSRPAERAAFFAAYAGLPLLYAAFNTFEPVHDAILRVLSLAGGSGVGSPLDPTDSLVIPVGLAAALWVWRRKTGDSNSLRMRLGLLTAAVAALATVATSPPDAVAGTTIVGAEADGTVFSGITSFELDMQYVIELYSAEEIYDRAYLYSCDGGLTWSESCEGRGLGESVVLGGQSAETSRGTYIIEGTDIVRARDGEREVVYSAAYLQEKGNVNLQSRVTWTLGPRQIATMPYSLVYDEKSSNVVVAMGLQGVAVGTPDGRWTRVTVGEYAPTDFSLIRKALLLLDWELLLIASALALSFTSIGLVLAEPTVFALRSPSSQGKIWRIVVATLSILSSGAGLFFFSENDGYDYMYIAPFPAAAGAAISIFTLALVSRQLRLELRSSDRGRIWIGGIAAFLGMHGLVALPFFLWVQLGMDLPLVKISAIVLVALAALFLKRYAAEIQRAANRPRRLRSRGDTLEC